MIRTLLLALVLAIGPVAAHASQSANSRAGTSWPVTPASATTLASASADCGVLRRADDYQLCTALRDGDCSIVAGDQYWQCRGFTEQNCALSGDSRDYWFCTSLYQQTCGLNATGRDFMLCQAILQDSCGLTDTSEGYSWCTAMGPSLRRLVAPPQAEEAPPLTVFIP